MAQEGQSRRGGQLPYEEGQETFRKALAAKRKGRLREATKPKGRPAPKRDAKADYRGLDTKVDPRTGRSDTPQEKKPGYYNPKFSSYMGDVQQNMRDVWETYGRDYDTGRVSDKAMYAGLEGNDPRGRGSLGGIPPTIPSGAEASAELDEFMSSRPSPGQYGRAPALSRDDMLKILEKRYPNIRNLPPVILDRILVSGE